MHPIEDASTDLPIGNEPTVQTALKYGVQCDTLSKAENTKQSTKQSEKQTEKKKQIARDSFLNNVPQAAEWATSQVKLVADAKGYERLVRSFTTATRNTELYSPETGSRSSIKQLHYFHTLILLSYCVVLEKKAYPYEEVDNLTQEVIQVREMDRKRLRRQAMQVNRLIASLVEAGWTFYKATELFLLS